MTIKLTPLELKQLLIWADNTIAGGHFGDGNVVFPEEGFTLQKLKKSPAGEIEISPRDLKIMLIWVENAVGSTMRGMTSEETSLIAKLKELEKNVAEQMK